MALLRHMTLVRSALVYKPRRLATRIDNPPGGRKRPLEKGVAMSPSEKRSLSDKSREKLAAVSTATLTTALFKRGFRNTFIQGIHRLNPGGPAMVGPAYTLRYIPAREDLDHLRVFEDRSHPQRKGVEECPPGHVFVIDSRRNAAAASAGGILVTRLWKRGVAGIVTDGGLRDSPQIARMPFPAYHAAATTRALQ